MAATRSMMFWKKDRATASSGDIKLDPENSFEGKDVGLFSLFLPFIKNYATSMSKTKNPAKLPYPTCFYLPQSSLMHMVHLQMSHIDLLLDASVQVTPAERFLAVMKYNISTWALTKFPYKPIISLLGETAHYTSPYYRAVSPNDQTYVIAENLRKDPPYSCFYITNPLHGVTYEGSIELVPKFKQAHVHVPFKGQNKTTFVHPGGLFREEYYSDIPDLIIRLLRMHTELSGEVHITSTTGFAAKISFKEKSLFSKAKNQITGSVSYNGMDIYLIDGAWDDIVYLTDLKTQQRVEFLNRAVIVKNQLMSLPLEQQPITSCERIWNKMLDSLRREDFDAATALKAKINAEENNILEALNVNNEVFVPRYFALNSKGEWQIKDPAYALSLGQIQPADAYNAAPVPQI